MDAYARLGLEAGAHEQEIRTAYRRLAREYHPDRFATAQAEIRVRAQERMAEINIAFAILTDPDAARRHRHSEVRRDAALKRRRDGTASPDHGTVFATSADTSAPPPGPTSAQPSGFDYRRDASSEFDVPPETDEDNSGGDDLFTMQKDRSRGGFFRRK